MEKHIGFIVGCAASAALLVVGKPTEGLHVDDLLRNILFYTGLAGLLTFGLCTVNSDPAKRRHLYIIMSIAFVLSMILLVVMWLLQDKA